MMCHTGPLTFGFQAVAAPLALMAARLFRAAPPIDEYVPPT